MQESIILHNLLPEVFAGEAEEHRGSDIWLKPSFIIEPGQRLLVRAASGKGKSSLCSFLYGSRTDYAGNLTVDGADIRGFSASRLARMRQQEISVVPQELKLFGQLTALENIELKNRLTGFRKRPEIISLLEEAGLAGLENRRADRLSIGQQQRVAIIRALCQPFRYLLLDEPVSHLDRDSNATVAGIIGREAAAQGAAVIVTSVGNDLLLDGLRELNL